MNYLNSGCKEVWELLSGPLQDAFSDLLDTANDWLKAHKADIIWFSNVTADVAKTIFDTTKMEAGLLARLEANTSELMRTQDIIKKIREFFKWLGEGEIAGKINAALEWAFQPFKWLWEKLQNIGIVGPSGAPGGIGSGSHGFGVGEGTGSGGHGAERRGKFGHGGGGNANLGKEGWWTPERQKHAYDKLRAGGLSDMGAKSLISRWVNVEATGGPGSVNPSSGAVGIAQWLGDRKKGITSSTSFDDQLAHALKEIEEDAPGAAVGAGKLLKDAKTKEEGAIGASAFERAEGYNAQTRRDNFTDKTMKGIERVEKAIGEAGKAKVPTPSSGQGVIPGHGGSAQARI